MIVGCVMFGSAYVACSILSVLDGNAGGAVGWASAAIWTFIAMVWGRR